jgi:hypothetical protein
VDPTCRDVANAASAAMPLLYLRLTARFRLTWRRELASIGAVFAAGLLLGLLVGSFMTAGPR